MRIVESQLFNENPHLVNGNKTLASVCNTKFSELRTILGRKYTSMEGVKACFMAEKLGYIKLKSERDDSIIGITGEGLKFTSFSYLVDSLAKTILNVGTIVTIIISALALVVSILAFSHK